MMSVATMSRATVTKLAVLVILAFIVCLPEFFTDYKVSSMSLHCLRCQLSGGEEIEDGSENLWRNYTCCELWQHLSSTAANQRNTTEPDNCFVCEADVNIGGFDVNSSSSVQNIYLDVWLYLQLTNSVSVNLTLLGRYNHTSPQLHLSDQEEEGVRTQNNDGPTMDFLNCTPSLDTANQSRCLLWLSNQTFTAAKGRLPWRRTTKDEWRCVVRVAWLLLLCVVLLLIIITVSGEIYRGTRGSEKATIHQINYTIQGQHVIDKERYCEVKTPKVLDHITYVPHYWSALSTIEEVDTPDETKMLLNENMDNGCNGNLHYRCSLSSSNRKTDLQDN